MGAFMDMGTALRGARIITLALIAIGALALLTAVLAASLAVSNLAFGQVTDDPAAHQAQHEFWIAKGKYKATNGNPNTHCCGPNDCKQWPLERTSVNSDGSINLFNEVGQFYMTVPANEVRASEDHFAWFCKRGAPSANESEMRCFFYPQGGM